MSVYVDITEFITRPHRTGIQRVTAELCRNWPDDSVLTPVKVTRDARLVKLPDETLHLISDYFNADTDSVDACARRVTELGESAETTAPNSPLQENDTLLCPELFFDPVRVYYYESRPISLQKRYCFIIYDLLPLTHPEFFVPDAPHDIVCRYYHLIRTVNHVAFISRATQAAFSQRLLRSDHTLGAVTWLGSDSLGPRPDFLTEPVCRDPHFVVVGTIEPRKNHLMVLEAFEPLFQCVPDLRLTFVGRIGWLNSDDRARIESARSRYKGFNICSIADDATVQRYIRESRATIFASAAEGFGLPPVESLWLGTPVICSGSIPSLETCGIRGVHVLETLTAQQIRSAVLEFIDPSYAETKVKEAQALQLPTWKSFACAVRDWVTKLSCPIEKDAIQAHGSF
jgi:glycosyltransferase involved in cell wall biosynthesis